jgi:hypothetical protein
VQNLRVFRAQRAAVSAIEPVMRPTKTWLLGTITGRKMGWPRRTATWSHSSAISFDVRCPYVSRRGGLRS